MSVLVSAMIAGASAYGPHAAQVIGSIVGAEAVKEVTKDAYKALKATLVEVCGRTIGRTAEKLEADPTSREAQQELALQLGDIPEEDAKEVNAKLDALLAAMVNDTTARKIADKASIKIDVEAGGHVNIDNVRGAVDFDVKAKAGGDFDFKNIQMGGGGSSGN